VAQQIFGARGRALACEVTRRPDHHEARRIGEAHLHHVAFNRFAQSYAGVVALATMSTKRSSTMTSTSMRGWRWRNVGSTGSITSGQRSAAPSAVPPHGLARLGGDFGQGRHDLCERWARAVH